MKVKNLLKKIRMPNDFYTLLIIPDKKHPVKKISASTHHIKVILLSAVLVILAFSYFAYDYATIKRDTMELEQLRQMTATQREQIESLKSKMTYFEQRVIALKEIDEKIRTMAGEVNKKLHLKAKLDIKEPRAQVLGVGGPMPAEESGNSKIATMHEHMDRLIQDVDEQEKSFNELMGYLKNQKSIMAVTPSLWPVKGWVTSEFGSRISPFSGRGEFHSAIDIATKLGNPIIAPADGVVVDVARRADMGNMITIHHARGISTSFAHLLRTVVKCGQVIRKGEIIGYVGSSGRSTGAHLHYSVLMNGVPVNPRRYLD